MGIKRTTLVSTRWDLVDLDSIEQLVKSPINVDGKFRNTSEAIRECAKVGVKVHNYQEMMKDPEKANEFREKMQVMIQNDEVIGWAHTLDNNQIDGFIMALQMEKESRYKVQKLV